MLREAAEDAYLQCASGGGRAADPGGGAAQDAGGVGGCEEFVLCGVWGAARGGGGEGVEVSVVFVACFGVRGEGEERRREENRERNGEMGKAD